MLLGPTFVSADAKRENKQTKEDDAEKIKKKKNIKDDDDDCFRSIRPRCRRRRRRLSREDSMLISIALVLLSPLCNIGEDFIVVTREKKYRVFFAQHRKHKLFSLLLSIRWMLDVKIFLLLFHFLTMSVNFDVLLYFCRWMD